MAKLFYRHYRFQDGSIVTYGYEKGDQERLKVITDSNVQNKHFPETIEETVNGEVVNKFTNPLVEAYETTRKEPKKPKENNPLDDIEPV